ncbi:MAG: NUDIX domain-containing protein [Gemmatimonadetes bacterium]|nr:NUDIX domain-containing protein [Gemmatimonadota bacterium]
MLRAASPAVNSPRLGASFWAMPGGGLELNEDHLTALRRELIEETGIVEPEIGPEIWTNTPVPVPEREVRRTDRTHLPGAHRVIRTDAHYVVGPAPP